MTWNEAWDIIKDALFDSLKVLAIVFVFYIILSFFEAKIAKHLNKDKKIAPFLGSALGLIPQCGLSVVASDLYIKEHITAGTLIAVFIACSDEALPIILSCPDKILMVIPLLLIKLIVGFTAGYLVDFIYRKGMKEVHDHKEHCHHNEEIHVGCCHHEIDNEEENKWHKHLVHPLLHSLKLFAYVLVINLLFGFGIELIGVDNFNQFLTSNRYLAPLFAVVVGLIPNCASSVILTELYLLGGIGFGACIGGLCVNAGLGMLYLFKNKEIRKKAFIILAILVAISLMVGYVTSIIIGF